MLFRIDLEHYLTHMIDYFTRDELVSINYVIIGTIPSGSTNLRMGKFNELYPSTELIEQYALTGDIESIRKGYYDELKDYESLLYSAFINPVLQGHSIMIICRRDENPYVDILTDYLREKTSLDCIDLNKLFLEGKVGSIEIDMSQIKKKSIEIRRKAAEETYRSHASTVGGRAKLLGMMSVKEKIRKLKDLGIKVGKSDLSNLDTILTEVWVEEE